jgi:putative FmdB family regulatory protein
MPLYEFQCDNCDNVFEELVSASQATPTAPGVVCPRCGSRGTRRKVSRIASRVAGSTGVSSQGACAPSG